MVFVVIVLAMQCWLVVMRDTRRSIPCMWGNHDVLDEVTLPIPYPDAGPALLDYRTVTRLHMDFDALEHNLDHMLMDGESAFAAYCADLAPQCVVTAFGQGRAEGYRCCKNHVDTHCRANETRCLEFAPECMEGTQPEEVSCSLGSHSWRNPTATPLLHHINLYGELSLPSVDLCIIYI